MRIGFFGNANNYPFMLALAIRKLGHEVVFVVDSDGRLNRPESRYAEITQPYPPWIVDCSPLELWAYPANPSRTETAVSVLKGCDALVLNEFGPSIWGRVGKPAFALLTGTDLEVLADPQYAEFVAGGADAPMSLLQKLRLRKHRRAKTNLKNHLLRLVEAQRDAIRNAVGVSYFPKGMLPNADRLFDEIGVGEDRRVFFQLADIERHEYASYPENRKLRLFNVARITWRKPRDHFICELDYKGTDVLIRGLGMFVRQARFPIEVRLVRKGADIEMAGELLEQEGLAPNVTWLDELDQSALSHEYRAADVVTEHFGRGSIGMGALDAMATGRPVIANAGTEFFRRELGEPPPICHAMTAEEVCDQLLRLAEDRASRVSIGRLSRRYVERYFTAERAARIVLDKLQHAI